MEDSGTNAVYHDFKTPLARLRLRAEMLPEGQLREHLIRDIDEMSAMVGATLDYMQTLESQESANTIARYLVVPPHRRGGQAQYIENPIISSARDSRLSDVLEWTRKNLAEAHSVDSLAERALMSRRSFTRHFRQLMGTTVLQWLLSARLTQAQRLLERTDHSIETISRMTGFGSPTAFRTHFRKAFAVTPQQWRQTFRQSEK